MFHDGPNTLKGTSSPVNGGENGYAMELPQPPYAEGEQLPRLRGAPTPWRRDGG